MYTPLISVIIPVYNTEKYLSRCVDSVLAQSYTNFELILVDDGSKDNSGKICDNYALQDARVRVFHQENKGVSVARNKGIDESKGEYISFIDSDDWVEKDYLQAFVLSHEKHKANELISQSVQQIDAKQKEIYYREFETLTFCYAKLFDRVLLNENNIRFPEGVKTGEDTLFMINYLNSVERVYHIEDINYHYETNQEGACERHKGDAQVALVALTRLLTILQNNTLRNEIARKYTIYRTKISFHHFINDLYSFQHTKDARIDSISKVFSIGRATIEMYPKHYKIDGLVVYLFSKGLYSFGDMLNLLFWKYRNKKK